MQTARLLKLAKFLRTRVPVERFNMATWAGNHDISFNEEMGLDCGTSACAMGWATTIPAFKKLGLTLKSIGRPGSCEAQLQYRDLISFDAAAEFMGLTSSQTKHLFAPSYYEEYPTPSDVAARIEQLVHSTNEIGNG